MTDEINTAKKAIRKAIAIRKKERTPLELEDLSTRITQHLEQTEMFQSASCIAFYHALPGEVQTQECIERWYRQKQILLPLVEGNDLRLLLYEGPASVHMGAFGILEPDSNGKEISGEKIDLIIVPGVAFDNDKNRLGRGKGFYDRLLSSLNAPTIGVAYQFQMIPEVPTNDLDKKMDYIITENGILR